MKPSCLEILACPRCQERLSISGSGGDSARIQTGSLECPGGHRYPVVGGVPRFVDSEWYASNFGFEWNLHNRTQIDGGGHRESELTFAEKTGFTPEEIRGSRVLDVGCGMGRFSDVASRWEAESVVGVDLSTAVQAANANLGSRSNVHIAQANVFELPFAPASFDFIFSIGVLHHTPNTRRAFDQLPRLLRPGGKIAIWLYSTSMRKWCWTSDAYRVVTTRLPKRLLHRMSRIAVPLYEVEERVGRRSTRLQQAMRLALPTSHHPIPEWRVLDTFDWYSPRYQWKHSESEVHGWFVEAGLSDIKVLPVETSVQGTFVSRAG